MQLLQLPEGDIVQAHAGQHDQEAVPQHSPVVFVLLLPGLWPLRPHFMKLGPVFFIGGCPRTVCLVSRPGVGCGSWRLWGSCRAELVVIAAATLLTAQHLVCFTQLHKATVQGWVPGVPVRVQLFGLGEESSFNFFSAGTRLHPQEFIVVTGARPVERGPILPGLRKTQGYPFPTHLGHPLTQHPGAQG